MGMKVIKTTVGVKIKGRELPIFVEDIDNTTKSVNFEVSKSLYRKFEYIVGRGNVSEVLRKFMLATVRKYERLSDLSNLGNHILGVKNGKQKQKEKG